MWPGLYKSGHRQIATNYRHENQHSFSAQPAQRLKAMSGLGKNLLHFFAASAESASHRGGNGGRGRPVNIKPTATNLVNTAIIVEMEGDTTIFIDIL